MPAGSKMDPPLARAKPISASVITYLRRKTKELKEVFATRERSEKMISSNGSPFACNKGGNIDDCSIGDWPPDQEEKADEALYRQIGAASHSQALVLMGDFNHPDICWRDNTAGQKQSRRFLECIDDNFLLQVIEEPMRRGALLDLTLTNKERLARGVKLKGSLGCSDHEMVEFKILSGGSRAKSKITTLDFRRADFDLFKDMLGRVS
ncbi:hypothetical protein GRJ2_003336700 [Grus japonensis]|uniref:Endonuclease/exonuclease/phosphatase domain-containing protein n=1 Tax=Grus japonensis TaxID=30415 RepID=A0ABC9YHE1_GRUJA